MLKARILEIMESEPIGLIALIEGDEQPVFFDLTEDCDIYFMHKRLSPDQLRSGMIFKVKGEQLVLNKLTIISLDRE